MHKTFHRYTTRRKQGGAQSSNDKSKGKANSAGAGIRRYNEQALDEEIQELLKDWKSFILNSSRVFIRAPVNSKAKLFADLIPDGINCYFINLSRESNTIIPFYHQKTYFQRVDEML